MGAIACPQCESRLKVSEEWRGRKIRCRSCGAVFVVGGGSTAAESTAGPARKPPGQAQSVREAASPAPRGSAAGSRTGKQWEVGETVPLSGGPVRRPSPSPELEQPAPLSPVAKGLSFLPAVGALGLVAIGGALGGGIGGGLAGLLVTVNLAICRQARWPLAVRYASVLAIGLISNAIILGAVVYLLKNMPGEKSPTAPRVVMAPAPRNPPAKFPVQEPGSRPLKAESSLDAPGTLIPQPPESAGREHRAFTFEPAGPYGRPEGADYRTVLGPLDRTIDPVGDCRIVVDGASAEIEVPGTFHDLVRRPGETRFAPRQFRSLEGDFFVKVTVPAYEPPRDPPAEHSSVAYNGAGLYAVGDDGRSIRLERASFERNGILNTYFLASLQIGDSPPTEEERSTAADATYHLFLERRGGKLLTGISTDNVSWATWPPMDFPARKVDVGIAAVNTASRPFKAAFRDIQLRVP
ncbi:hypothetical protein [Aquisphaera insulae]|uniref:hypothetical protein n=1 Tax=Aquisphaera insulae TaxID=2712864 RepID=UPI0013EA1BD4|nr:hypothetical protein [Aquisphaera insulae]